jgi:His/Glu/Gln/Arg/opine family amino acid ABC transporter permease subunit
MITIIQAYGFMLIQALGKTLLLTLLSLFFAMIIGMIISLMNVGKNPVFNFIGIAYVDGVRGVPLIVLAYFIYFGVPTGIKMMNTGF